ncbi:MAG: hypothetical protein HGB05_08310 [Chloroflexi bacterium]|nr:hypothetical protein [Chloroflexota bacterium]
MAERIQTRHPDRNKQGVNIDRAKYEAMKDAIVSTLRAEGELTFDTLARAVEQKFHGKFDGSIRWYFTTVKLDLEARHVLQRVPGSSPQRIQLAAPSDHS